MIKKIKWHNHAILGNLELDFTKPDGTIYDTIVLAGENGTGKTTVLETLSTFLNLGSIEPFEYINYIADGIPYTIAPNPDDNPQLGFHFRKNEIDGTTEMIRTNRNNSPQSIESDQADIRHYGFSYSKARSGFNTQKVRSTTTQRNRQISRRIKKHLWLSNRSWARDVHSFGILHSWGALAGKSCSAQASSIWLIAGAFRRTQSK